MIKLSCLPHPSLVIMKCCSCGTRSPGNVYGRIWNRKRESAEIITWTWIQPNGSFQYPILSPVTPIMFSVPLQMCNNVQTSLFRSSKSHTTITPKLPTHSLPHAWLGLAVAVAICFQTCMLDAGNCTCHPILMGNKGSRTYSVFFPKCVVWLCQTVIPGNSILDVMW